VVHKSPSATLAPVQQLPVLQPAPERADAARNRAKILCSARQLADERGLAHVSMDDIATHAGVGKGTLFRRFGDRASLAHALLEETEVAFQEGLIRGAPPLGPGAPPCERIVAFGEAFIDLWMQRSDLLVVIQAGPRWLSSGIYGGYRAHLAYLIAQAAPDQDAEFAADALLQVLRADLLHHLANDRGMSVERLKSGFGALATGLLT
jgi:AcrR family transcriptional regulator